MKSSAPALETVLTRNDAVMRAEVDHYVENSKKTNFFTKMAEYTFWSATTILLGLVAGAINLSGATLTSNLAPILGFPAFGVIGTVVAIATFAGSLYFSNKATDMESRNAVVQSDIDSRNQAHRMVQAFAKAHTQGQAPDTAAAADTPFTAPAASKAEAPLTRSWVERTSPSKAAPAATEGWAARVDAERQAEEAKTLNALSM